jgi:hypothetical protein
MFIKKCDFKCIKILAKCDTRTEYVYCCHFIITCLSCEKYINLEIPMLISKPAFHFLFQELFALIYWRIKYFKLKYGLSLYGVYIGIWLFALYHKQKYLLFIKVPHYNNQNLPNTWIHVSQSLVIIRNAIHILWPFNGTRD